MKSCLDKAADCTSWSEASLSGCEETLSAVIRCGGKSRGNASSDTIGRRRVCAPCDQWLTTSFPFILLWWLEKKVEQDHRSKKDLRMNKASPTWSFPSNNEAWVMSQHVVNTENIGPIHWSLPILLKALSQTTKPKTIQMLTNHPSSPSTSLLQTD